MFFMGQAEAFSNQMIFSNDKFEILFRVLMAQSIYINALRKISEHIRKGATRL